MGWDDTWDDILRGGSPRWKVTCPVAHEKALSHLTRHLPDAVGPASIFCPLAGDDAFVHLLWKQGHAVTAIDLVPAAVAAMRDRFEGDWSKEDRDDGAVVWTHESGRVTLYCGDALKPWRELVGKFDAVYDKDSFGALGKSMRSELCSRIAEYTKEGAIVYIEVKLKDNHDDVKDIGPPFSLRREVLMEVDNFGGAFDYIEGLGAVYDLSMPAVKQTGHVMKRKAQES